MLSNSEHWQRRFEEALLVSERAVADFEKELMAVFNYTLSQVRKEMDAFFQKYAVDGKLPYAYQRQLLDKSELTEFHVALTQWQDAAQKNDRSPAYKEMLQTYTNRVRITRLQALEANILNHIENMKDAQIKGTRDVLESGYAYSYVKNGLLATGMLGVRTTFVGIDMDVVELALKEVYAGVNYSSAIWKDMDKLIDTLKTVIPRSLAAGYGRNKVGDEIAKTMNVSKNHGRVVARTEMSKLHGAASAKAYEALGLEKYKLLATLDLRTSDICRHMDGKIFNVADRKVGVNFQPFHPQCRTTSIPYLEDGLEDEEDTRAARNEDGKTIFVRGDMTQEEWIRKYAPPELHDKLLRFKQKYDKDS